MKLLRLLPLVAILTIGLTVVGCNTSQETVSNDALFGDGTLDGSRVLAEVNGLKITEAQLDLRYDELSREDQNRFKGEDGRRVFLRQMIDEVLRVREAEERKLNRDPIVARVLIAQRRGAMDRALLADLTKGQDPDIDQVRDYFNDHRDTYVRLGAINASHIECLTRADAMKAYQEITVDKRPFAYVVHDYTKNDKSIVEGGDLGWFNKGGFIPLVTDSRVFSEAIWDLEVGVNEPIEIDGRWHVVKIHERKYQRKQTLEEAYDRVVSDMLGEFHQDIVEQWLRDARKSADLTFYGEYRPGHGKSAKELLERAFYSNDPQQKLDLLGLLVDDYPDSEQADDALFMAGNVALDTWGDRRQASLFFSELIRRYPDSDYVEDCQYILDHMSDPDFVNPQSIEDLRQGQ